MNMEFKCRINYTNMKVQYKYIKIQNNKYKKYKWKTEI